MVQVPQSIMGSSLDLLLSTLYSIVLLSTAASKAIKNTKHYTRNNTEILNQWVWVKTLSTTGHYVSLIFSNLFILAN